MPQVFRIGSWWVFFWPSEGMPTEPIHVHVSQGRPTENATRAWVARAGGCLVRNDNSRIPERAPCNICRIV